VISIINFLQVRIITIDDYINEINSAIDSRNYLSALVLSLMIPDICSKHDKVTDYKNSNKYVKWFDKYVYKKYYNYPRKSEIKNVKNKEMYKIKFNGSTCYALRNAIMHSGKPHVIYNDKKNRIKANVDYIELCVNGSSDRSVQHGEGASITLYDNKSKSVSIRINIVIFIDKMLAGYNDFLADNNINEIRLFNMIDWDEIGGKIVFTPNR